MNTPAPSPHLTHDQMHAVLTDWHAQCCDDPLYNHMSHNFEDMADILSRAQTQLKDDQEHAAWQGRDDSWMRQDEMPMFAGTRQALRALTVQVAV